MLEKSRKSLRLHGSVARDLGVEIVSGRLAPGDMLDREIEASKRLQISRTAYREAVRILSAKGLVEARPKIGTSVSAKEKWQLLDPDVLEWIFSGDPDTTVLQSLFELRRIIEPEAAALAAVRRNSDHLATMRKSLDQMAKYTLRVEQGQLADVQFHDALFAASANPFIHSIANSVTTAILALTRFKQREAPLRRDPVPDHLRVYDAIRLRRADEAHRAMADLIRLAILDTPFQQKTKKQRAKS